MQRFKRYMAWPDTVVGGEVRPQWREDSNRFAFELDGHRYEVCPESGTMDLASPAAAVGEPGQRTGEDVDLKAIAVTAAGDHLQWHIPERARSPNGKQAVVLAMDTTGVHRLPVVTFDAIEHVEYVPYPKAGTPGAQTSAWLVDIDTEAIRRSPVQASDGDLLWLVDWSLDGARAFFLHLSRHGKTLQLLALDPQSDKVETILTETADTFVAGLDFASWGPRHQCTVLKDGRHFLWLSERDGHRHVHLYELTGRHVRQLTQGTEPVESVEGVDLRNGWVFYTALMTDRVPSERHLYRCGMSGEGAVRLTEARGHHEVFLSPSLRYFVDNHSTPLRPPVSELRSMDGRHLMALSMADVSALRTLERQGPELFTAKAGDGVTDLCGALYRPANFDAARRYPVIDYIYAGPFESSVPKKFIPAVQALQAEALAQLGFIVTIIDARGLPGRNKAFQDFTHGRIGQCEIADHAHVLRNLAAERPFMDMDRVGIIGHSWGGYFALRAMLTAPELFKVGVASAPGELTEHAFIMEPYMDLPANNPDGYTSGMNAPLAANLRGKLLLAHGTSDVNAPLSTTMRMIKALTDAGKPYDLLLLPGVAHSLQRNAYWQQAVCSYFVEHLA